MATPGTTSRIALAVLWLAVGAALVAVPVWLGWTRWSTILHGHPLLPALAVASFVFGVMALAWAIATLLIGEPPVSDDEPEPTARQLRRRARWRIAFAVPALLICVALAGGLAWARPFAATEVALAATQTSETVRVADRLTWLELVPTRRNKKGEPIRPTTGLVFAPGARVDARAYANILRPLAEAGYFVAILKEPLGLSLPGANHTQSVLDVHPQIVHWAVGGHSLGGVAAASFADSHTQVKGLVLYASYPATTLTRTDLKVLSVSADADGLSTPGEVDAAKADLPSSTTYAVVAGGTHAFFGDYGDQPGDGVPLVPRAKAQEQITKATAALLARLPPPKK